MQLTPEAQEIRNHARDFVNAHQPGPRISHVRSTGERWNLN